MSNLQLEHFNVTGHSDFPFKFTLKGYAEDAVGQIIIDKGIVKFEGNFDESAKTFIDFVAKRWSEQWKNPEKRANEFDRFMDAMDTAKEALDAGTPLDLESLFNGEVASAMFATMFAGEFVRSGAKTTLSWITTSLQLAISSLPSNAKKVRRPVNASQSLRPLWISVTESVTV